MGALPYAVVAKMLRWEAQRPRAMLTVARAMHTVARAMHASIGTFGVRKPVHIMSRCSCVHAFKP